MNHRRPWGSVHFPLTFRSLWASTGSLLSVPSSSYGSIVKSPVGVSSSLNTSCQNLSTITDGSAQTRQTKSLGRQLVEGTALGLLSLALFTSPALATATKAAEHLHTGQKIANFFMNFGLPKWAVLATISAMPVVELRGAVPVGIWMGLPITQVLPICVLGNMVPIIPILLLLRNKTLKYVHRGY
jgi:Putative small multi-drug export protein